MVILSDHSLICNYIKPGFGVESRNPNSAPHPHPFLHDCPLIVLQFKAKIKKKALVRNRKRHKTIKTIQADNHKAKSRKNERYSSSRSSSSSPISTAASRSSSVTRIMLCSRFRPSSSDGREKNFF